MSVKAKYPKHAYANQQLMLLLEQPGPLRAYKVVNSDYTSPYFAGEGIIYSVGSEVSSNEADYNPHEDCGKGINVATLAWIHKTVEREGWHKHFYRIVVIEFMPEDIAAIPMKGAGKFRITRGKVVRELNQEEFYKFGIRRKVPWGWNCGSSGSATITLNITAAYDSAVTYITHIFK